MSIAHGRQVVVIAESPADGNAMAQALFNSGVQPKMCARQTVVLARRILSESLRDINSWMLERRTPWLLVKTSGTAGWVGPLFVPGRTGCWECLAHRLRENQWRDRATTPVRRRTLEHAIDEVLKWLKSDRFCELEGRIRTIPKSPELSNFHVLTRRPQCPECGDSKDKNRTRQRIRLRSRAKIPHSQRSCSIFDTLKRLAAFESDVTGIVTIFSQVTLWRNFHICLGVHSRPLPVPAARHRLALPAQPVVGQGITMEESRASCIAEAIERYSIRWHGDEDRLKARESDLNMDAFPLRSLALWSPRQLQDRKRWNREIGGFNWIPETELQDDTELDWTAVWSLTLRRRRYVPTAYCYLYYPSSIYFADSNGCASGNVLEEATIQGFLELVEREAVGIWWYNRIQRPAVRVNGPMYDEVERELAARDRTLSLLDLTSDLAIPVFAAVSAKKMGTRILVGTGAHLNPQVAVNRAVGELLYLVETLDDLGAMPKRRVTTMEMAVRRWLLSQNMSNNTYLIPSGKPTELRAFTDWSLPDLKDEIDWCVTRARSRGLEVLVLDMTRRDLNFPVVRVIVPGMRHCWARYGPGRLYNVPVALGWRQHPLKETELNPIPYFL